MIINDSESLEVLSSGRIVSAAAYGKQIIKVQP